MSLFSYEGKFMQALQKIAEAIYVSLLWFLFSLPVVTIGASTSALYYTVQKSLMNNRGYVWQEFWSSFKSNFKRATGVWLVISVLLAFAGVNFVIFYTADPSKSLGNNAIWFAIMLFPVLGFSVWFFPYIARFENTLKNSVKNAFLFAYKHLKWTVPLILLLVLFCIITVLLMPLVLIVPALYMWICCSIQEKVFKSYLTDSEVSEEEKRNNPELYDKEDTENDE